MPVRRDLKLEKYIDDAARKNEFQPLEDILQDENYSNATQKCSKQFFSKLDTLICRELDNKEIKNVSTLLNVIEKFGNNISIHGENGLASMMKQGLVKTMVTWFDKSKEILTCEGIAKDEDLINLVEDFFDALMIVHDVNDGQIEMLENFTMRTCSLIADPTMNVFIQQEAVRKLNGMLDTMPREARKKILSTKEMLATMNNMGKRILDGGDYDLQVAITEALCRMTSEKQRAELATQWFSMEFVTNAFKGIKDSEFETDCRKFLNQVNGMLGNKRRVFTYPCLSAFLEKYELQMPSDEKLEEFWIDFNIGSRSISFYIAADDNGEDHQWETVSILEEDVEMYSVEGIDINSKTLLLIVLKNAIKVGCKEGGKIALYFDSALDVLEVARKVYGANKCKGTTKKQAISVAKTAVHIIFDESGSQILIPESHVSPSSGTEKCSSEIEAKPSVGKKLSSATMYQKQNTVEEENATVESKMITPCKRKMSEASMIIPSAGGFTIRSPLIASRTSPRKRRVKPPLKMINSAERTAIPFKLETESETLQPESPKGHQVTERKMDKSKVGAHREKHLSAAEVAEMLQNEEKVEICQKECFDEKADVVPDSQPVRRKDKSLLPGLMDGSFDEHRTYAKHTSLTSDNLTSSSVKQKTNISSGLTFQQDHVFSDRVFKQQAFYSIFEGKDSPKQAIKPQDKNVKTEQLQETFEEINERNNKTFMSKSETKHSETKNIDKRVLKSIERKDICRKSETSSQYVHQSRTVEKSGKSSKMSTLDKGVNDNTTFYKEETRSRRRSEQKVIPEFPSPSAEPRGMKAKSKELMDAAESLISTIGSRYSGKGSRKSARKSEQSMEMEKSYANKSVLLSNKEKGHNRSFRQLTTTINLNLTRGQLVDDIYSFNLSGTDEPTIRLGVDEFCVTKQKSCATLTNEPKQDGCRSDVKKNEGKKPRNHHGRKHLFSDTDTENRCDDSKTDISWLRDSNRKEKPKLLGYSRHKTVKKPESLQEYTFPDIHLLKDEPEGKKNPKKVIGRSKANAKVDERTTDKTIAKRPRRTTVKNKSYKELSNSEPESEEESAKTCPLRAEKLDTLNHNAVEKQKKTHKALDEPGKKNSRKELKADSKETARTRKLGMPPVSSPVRPISVETMRSEEYYSETEYTHKHSTMARSTSSSLAISSPEKSDSPNNISGLSTKRFYTTLMKNHDKATIKSAENALKEETHEKDMSSSEFSPLSLPPLTPPPLDTSGISGKDMNINIPEFVSEDNKDDPLDISNYLSGKEPFESELKRLSASMLQSKREDSQPPSLVSTSSESREKMWTEMPHSTVHMSGPTTRTTTANLKRMYNNDSESDVDENINDEKEQEDEDDRKETLHPKKLFKVAVHDQFTCRVSESLSTLSGNEISVIEGDSWEAGSSDVGMMCQKISKEFTRKIQNRSRKMDYFTKQSLKSAQQHMTSMSFQIHECRINRLDEFQCTILEELENFEKDSQSLKHLEKEFSNFLKQQAHTFSTYHKSEQRRIHHLKSSFEKNVFHSIEYEENIFTSEMHLMREDMKLVQDRLLKEMQEEELLNVRRGLQSLFMAGTRRL